MKNIILLTIMASGLYAQVNPVLRDLSCSDTSVSANTITCDFTVAPANYAAIQGKPVRVKVANAVTGATTANFNSLGAIAVKKQEGGITTALAANDIRANQYVTLVYDGTNFQMQSQLGNAPAAGATIASTSSPLKGDGAGNGVAAAASDIVGLFSTCSGTQYLGADGACHTVSASSGSYLLDHVGLQNEVTLTTSTDNTIYTYTIPGGTIGAGKCAQFTIVWAHTTGSASLTPQFYFGGNLLGGGSWAGASSSVTLYQFRVCNRVGVTNAQDVYMSANINTALSPSSSSVSHTTAAVDTTANVVLKQTMNPGGTAANGVTVYSAELEVLR